MVDYNITKTKVRKKKDTRTNVAAKMGRRESASSEVVKYGISQATVRNWKKLNTQSDGRLKTRANKRKAEKRVFPLEYICDRSNVVFVQNVLDYIDENDIDIMSAIFSLGISLLKQAEIYTKWHVAKVLNEYSDIMIIDELLKVSLPDNEFDILGLIYQSYLQEGKKNMIGAYYTPQKVACNMTREFEFSNGELFFDPCCGSGAFLLAAKAENPNQLFGVDNDRVAVFISKVNLLLKYKNAEFIPQIYCFDFLMDYSAMQKHVTFEKMFDYIATNPPWGAMDDSNNEIYSITSKETFSHFFVKSFKRLKMNGIIRFLFPKAVLNVKAHKDIRTFILREAGLISITMYGDRFSGVTTKYVDIECRKGTTQNEFSVYIDDKKRTVDIGTVYKTKNRIFNLLSYEDSFIIQIVKARGKFSLQNSAWALGIVTGDNKRKVFTEYYNGMEKIYTGKEIQPYILYPAKNYILYDRENLQQVAKEEMYRASEKLVYKFISSKPVFAYDDSASLFLNSANILIPNIPFMDIKTVMAFLNSYLFQFMYIKLFGETKILKGNLIELPFPEISEKENIEISSLVTEILDGDSEKQEVIEKIIFSIYDLTDQQIDYIRSVVDGKVN